jgi:MFS family permease
MGIFNALMGVGYAAGPLTLASVGTTGWPPFLVCIGGFAACAAMLFAVTSNLSGFEDDGKEAEDVRGFMRAAPALLAAVLVSAATQTSAYSLLPVFGADYGVGEATLAALVTALSIGNIIVQIPLGLASERAGARTMMLACALVTALGASLLPAVIHSPLIWPVLVVLGGVGYGVYTMALVELGNRFSGSMLIAGNASFALLWGAGGIIGAPITGAMMQWIGPLGLPVVIAVLSLGLVGFAGYRAMARRAGDRA